ELAEKLFADLVQPLALGVIHFGIRLALPSDSAGEGFAAAREMTFIRGIDDLLPVGIRGLMLTGLLAALASTIDTHLNWGASYWSNDIYARLVCKHWRHREASNKELVLVARLSNILILGIALVIMANLGSIQQAWYLSLLFGAGMGSVLILRWLWERINLYSELAAIVASLVTAPVLLLTLGMETETEWIRLSIMALVTTAAAIGITWFTPSTDAGILKEFYRRVRPMGAWRKTAESVGDDPSAPGSELWSRLRVMALCAGSLFLLLVGLGRLMISVPGSSVLWTWILIVIGLALVPLWWRRAFVQESLDIDRRPKSMTMRDSD
ncbi:MAG: hypothetical protein IH968_05605, partial [Gemmatimonadetes bacterium]|nr:hypothetical protein [Gemmatimonadota bacterium]